jgi:hypothetical protein
MAVEEMMKSCKRDAVLGGKCNPVLYGMKKTMKGKIKSTWEIAASV